MVNSVVDIAQNHNVTPRLWRKQLKHAMIILSLFGTVLIVVSQLFISNALLHNLFISFGVAVLTISIVSLVERGMILSDFFAQFRLLADAQKTGLVSIRSPSPFGLQELKMQLLKEATKKIELLGLTLEEYAAFPEWQQTMLTKANGGCSIRVFLCEPGSEMMKKRYADERGYNIGPEGAERNLEQWRELGRSARKKGIEIRTYNSYPTTSVHLFDDLMIVYHYGKGACGTDSPFVLIQRGNNEVTKYYDNLLKTMLDSSSRA
jgi:hypothetical protein